MRVRFQQRLQLSMKSSGAFTLGVVVTVGVMAALYVYWQTRLLRVGREAEQFLNEADR